MELGKEEGWNNVEKAEAAPSYLGSVMMSCDPTHRRHPIALAELLAEILVVMSDCEWLETPESPRLGV